MAGIVFSNGEDAHYENLEALVSEIRANVTAPVTSSMDTMWLLLCTALVFFMQAGFALVEVGSVSLKNTRNILVKNLSIACIAGISFWLIGFGFAYGEGNSFIGGNNFALSAVDTDAKGYSYAYFTFQFAFAATAANIVSGAVAERCKMVAYFTCSFGLITFIYPIAVHWVWSAEGWASPALDADSRLFGVGVIDFAGCTVVHMVGGMSALIGAAILGPRYNRFQSGSLVVLPQQSITNQTVGTLLLWFGWYGFNCGSSLAISDGMEDVAGIAAVTTTISAASSAITATLLGWILSGTVDVTRMNNGALAGLVSVTAGANVMTPFTSCVTGVIGGLTYVGTDLILDRLKIDDVVSASPVHLFCGMWGTIAAGLFAEPENVNSAYGTGSCGLFYECNGNGVKQFFANIVALIAVASWAACFALCTFTALKYADYLRVDLETEKVGLDITDHGGEGFQRCISHQRLISNQQVQPVEDTELHACCEQQSEIENEAVHESQSL